MRWGDSPAKRTCCFVSYLSWGTRHALPFSPLILSCFTSVASAAGNWLYTVFCPIFESDCRIRFDLGTAGKGGHRRLSVHIRRFAHWAYKPRYSRASFGGGGLLDIQSCHPLCAIGSQHLNAERRPLRIDRLKNSHRHRHRQWRRDLTEP